MKKKEELEESILSDLSVLNKEMPHSVEAEDGIISCIFQNPDEYVSKIIEINKSDLIYNETTRIIYDSVIGMYNKNIPINTVTITHFLRDSGKLDKIGGGARISELFCYVPLPNHFPYYLKILENKLLLRNLIKKASRIMFCAQRADVNQVSVDQVISDAEDDILSIREGVLNDFKHIKEPAMDAIDDIQKSIDNPGCLSGLSTGFKKLDSLTTGLKGGEMFVLAARPSMGKAQPLDSDVLTPDGFVKMGDIKEGSVVIGIDGKPHNVIKIFPQGLKKVYKVNFSDGTSAECCDEHLWLTQSRQERRQNINSYSVKSLREIRNTLIARLDNRYNHRMPSIKPVEFKSKILPINPYLLGLLLGDGGFSHGSSIMFSNPEKDLQDAVINILDEYDCISFNGIDGRIKRKKRKGLDSSETAKAIKELGLFGLKSHEKFIPEIYLYSSVNDRIKLLQGLCDSDGYVCNKSQIEFSTSSERLKNDFLFLARSLGGMCKYSSRLPEYSYNNEKLKGKKSYRISVLFHNGVIPISSKKHLSKFNDNTRKKLKMITSVEEIGQKECQCILIDSKDHMYITNDFIPTHNTSLVMNWIENVAIRDNKNVAIFSLEVQAKMLTKSLICRLSGISMHEVAKGLMTRRQQEALALALRKVSDSGIFIDDTSGIDISAIKAKSRRLHKKKKLDLIAIDYLQLATYSESKTNREGEISKISSGIKSLAKELDIPIIVLAQLNRAIENRKEKRPILSDLRESGSIEQDADLVGLLTRSGYFGNKQKTDDEVIDENEALLILAKNRNGPTDDVPLRFNKELMLFTEPS